MACNSSSHTSSRAFISQGIHSVGFFCHAIIADSRQPTRPGEISTGLGDFPFFVARHVVEWDSEVSLTTSLCIKKRSSLVTIIVPVFV
jgi:hypothetical protein